MLKQSKQSNHRAQTVVEYTLILTIIVAITAVMGTMIRRSTQGWIRFVADQIGVQNESDQRFNDITQGHLNASYGISSARVDKQTLDVAGIINYVYDDAISGQLNTLTNLGIQPDV